jgi:hypothetical protein
MAHWNPATRSVYLKMINVRCFLFGERQIYSEYTDLPDGKEVGWSQQEVNKAVGPKSQCFSHEAECIQKGLQ